MHPYWTPVWFIKFFIALIGALVLAIKTSIIYGLCFFIGSMVLITILAKVLFLFLKVIVPGVIEGWETAHARRLLDNDLSKSQEDANDVF